MLNRGYIVRGEGGEPVRMVGSMIDVTERVQAEEEGRGATFIVTLPVRQPEGALLP